MKSKIVIILTSLSLLFTPIAELIGQNECKVLMRSISDTYEGKCKNGLAHGKGTAMGLDSYVGKFKDGLPHGKGKYTWSNGDYYNGVWKFGKRHGKGIMYDNALEKKVFGQWEDDNFIKEIEQRPYKIIKTLNGVNISIQEKKGGELGTVDIYFSRDGNTVRYFDDLDIISSSGSVNLSNYYCAVENSSYPVDIKINFTAANRLNVGSIMYEVEFRILKEGSWKVVVRY